LAGGVFVVPCLSLWKGVSEAAWRWSRCFAMGVGFPKESFLVETILKYVAFV
jgi:hypothetical protein